MQGYYFQQVAFPQIPFFCKRIIMITGIVFFLQAITYPWIDFYFSLYSVRNANFYFWQPLTYLFLHGGFFHLFFNMIVVWMFGSPFESNFGSRRFIELYLICGILSGLIYALMGGEFRLIGASASTYGLLTAFAYFWPRSQILVFGIFPVQAKNFIIALMVIGVFSSLRRDPSDNIAHFAHLLGATIAFIYLQLVYRQYSIKGWISRLKSKFKKTPKEKPSFFFDQKEQSNYYSVHLSESEKDASENNVNTEEKLESIFNKVIKSGAHSLTEEEKAFLRKVQHDKNKYSSSKEN